jgi:hypothetical protein
MALFIGLQQPARNPDILNNTATLEGRVGVVSLALFTRNYSLLWVPALEFARVSVFRWLRDVVDHKVGHGLV